MQIASIKKDGLRIQRTDFTGLYGGSQLAKNPRLLNKTLISLDKFVRFAIIMHRRYSFFQNEAIEKANRFFIIT
jgi:hypothetical protein